jgi:hypothetical protein
VALPWSGHTYHYLRWASLDQYKDFDKEDEELTTIQMSDKDPHLKELAETDGIKKKTLKLLF